MRRIHISLPGIRIPFGFVSLTVDVSWLLVIPVAVWTVAVIYVPIMGTSLAGFQVWAAATAIVGLVIVSLVVHSLAHGVAARLFGCPLPAQIPIYLLGDSAQAWPANIRAGQEAVAAIAGPLANGLLALLAYAVWNAQPNAFLNVISFFLIVFDTAIMVLNFTPAFPFDGGRLTQSIIGSLLARPGFARQLSYRLGFFVSGGFIVWGLVLIAARGVLSLQTGAGTIIFAGLCLLSLTARRGWEWDTPDLKVRSGIVQIILRASLAALVFLVMAAAIFSFVPLNYGLEAPGFTASVEPMVQLPLKYVHPASGSFILTTVIPQTPILFVEWVYGHLDRSIKLESADQIVTSNTSVQATAQQQYHFLLDSETTAVIVGLRLAGYQVNVTGDGAMILSILPESPANGLLQTGDIITSINGKPVLTPSDLTGQLALQSQGAILEIQVVRNGTMLKLAVPTIPPAEPNGPVRIGIVVEPHGISYHLPFPVKIVPKKVAGGPSAGLMFTLGVCNMVGSRDLTGGRKIAGTGTIDLDGNVGSIGGVQQKVIAAERAGAVYFFVPPDNYQDALAVARHIKVIKVATAQEAIDFLISLPPSKTP